MILYFLAFYAPNTVRCTDIPAMYTFQYEWDVPNDAGVCCSQYRVVTSNGTMTMNERNLTLENVSEANSSISVGCVDLLGTSGTMIPVTPNIGMC